MLRSLIISIAVAAVVLADLDEDGPTVRTQFGPLRGFYSSPLTNRAMARIFLGIPYAQPPVGDLRFEKPIPWTEKWSEPRDATKFGSACIPLHGDGKGDEDCLTLNVFLPERPSTDPDGYPVLVYVHGGGFGFGSAELYGYHNLSENFVSRGLIVATLQYRLGALGFASTGDKNLPGNLGLFDQAQAFRWIRANIAAFGGNPAKITAWGLSAGGASVGHLSLSPQSRDIFQNTIEMSGSPYNPWAILDTEEVAKQTKALAQHVGCAHDESAALKRCLKKVPVEDIIGAYKKQTKANGKFTLLQYGPVYDGDFFPKTVEQLIAEGTKKPTLIGVTELEAQYFAILGKDPEVNSLHIPKDKWDSFGKDELAAYIGEHLTPESVIGRHHEYYRDRVLNHYIRDYADVNGQNEKYYYLRKYTELTSDVTFLFGALDYAREKARREWPTYLYKTDYYNPKQFPEDSPVKGATHANEYPYMNGLFPVGEFSFNDDDKVHQAVLNNAISNFVKNGAPHPEWKPINPTLLRYGRINNHLMLVHQNLGHDPLEFWTSLFKELGQDLFRRKITRQKRDEL